MPNIKNILPKWSSKNIRKGSYSLGISVVVLAIAVVFNLVVGKLPSQYRNVDLSQTKLSTIGDTTKELVSNLDQDVTIYQIAESGSENETIQKLLERYEGLSSHVKVETMDPVLHPNFVSEYTADDLASNSLIVVGENRSKVIPYADMFESTINYQTYQYETTGFDGEGQVTSAISYVTTDSLPVMYTITGHEEATMTDDMKSAIEKENIRDEGSEPPHRGERFPRRCRQLSCFSPRRMTSVKRKQTNWSPTWKMAAKPLLSPATATKRCRIFRRF